jgi:hypothetical protein
VVRSNGELGGYRWGIERKRHLLAIENKMSAGSAGRPDAPAGVSSPFDWL